MRKAILSIFIISSIAFSLSSCKNNPNEEALTALNSLIFDAGTLQEDLNILSQAKVDSIRTIVGETQNQFNTLFTEKDSVLWSIASEYSRIDKPLKNYSKMHESMSEEIHNTIIQLKSLQHDAEHELLPSEDISKYLENEKEKTKTLVDKISLLYFYAEEEMKRFDSIQPIMLESITNLKADSSAVK